jgi:hypothetical protein
MDAFIPLVIGVTTALGFVVLGLVVFVLGKPPPSRPARRRSEVTERGKHMALWFTASRQQE